MAGQIAAAIVGIVSRTEIVDRKQEKHHEVSSAPRPYRSAAHHRRRKDGGWHHHPRHRSGKPQRGEVIFVGPGARNERGEIVPLDVKVGDTVLFGKWSGTEVKIDGQDLLIMKESDVMGIMESPAATVKKAA